MCIIILLQYVESIQSGAECILAVSSDSRFIVFMESTVFFLILALCETLSFKNE